MPEDGQRGPGSGGTAHRGRPGAGQARQNAGGESPPGDGQDHAGTPRPDALIPALDEGQLAALREIGREWDRVSADPQVAAGAAGRPVPGRVPRGQRGPPRPVHPVGARRGTRRAAATDRNHGRFRDTAHAAGPGRPGTEAAVFGPPLDATAIAVERMRKLVPLPCCRRTRCPGSPTGPRRCWPSWSWPACPACLLAACRRGDRVLDAGGRDLLPPDDPGLPARRRVLHRRERGTRPRPRRGRPLVTYLWTLHEQRPDLTLTVAVPELVDRHWWHRILHEHVAERLQPVLQSLPGWSSPACPST